MKGKKMNSLYILIVKTLTEFIGINPGSHTNLKRQWRTNSKGFFLMNFLNVAILSFLICQRIPLFL
jgi:hypothetical protein